jgi:hypothetical protein
VKRVGVRTACGGMKTTAGPAESTPPSGPITDEPVADAAFAQEANDLPGSAVRCAESDG